MKLHRIIGLTVLTFAIAGAVALSLGAFAPSMPEARPFLVDGEDYDSRLKAAQEAYEAGDYAKARKVATALTVIDEARWEGHAVLAAALARLGDADEAATEFAAAKEKAPADRRPLIDALARQASETKSAEAQASATKPPAQAQPSADDRLKVAKARVIAKELDAEPDSAKRAAILAKLVEQTKDLPAAREPKLKVLFLRARAALDLGDDELGWSTFRELRAMDGASSANDSELEILAQGEGRGWSADTKPDFDGRRQAKIEIELRETLASLKSAFVSAFSVQYDCGDIRMYREVSLQVRDRAMMEFELREAKRRLRGQSQGLFDDRVVFKHFLFDVRYFLRDQTSCQPGQSDEYCERPRQSIQVSLRFALTESLRESLARVFFHDEKSWKDDGPPPEFHYVRSDGYIIELANSQQDADRVIDLLGRAQKLTAELEVIEARVRAVQTADSRLATGSANDSKEAGGGAPAALDVRGLNGDAKPTWYEVLEKSPNPAVVTDDAGRKRIEATRLPWKVRDRKTGIVMLLCPPGEFMMGSPASEAGRSDDEAQHRVQITKAFYLSETEVTQEVWQKVKGANPSNFKGANNPVEQVSWNDCQSFCQSSGLRLASESEWEYACRAGTTGAYAGDLASMAWFSDNSGDSTHPVKQRKPNAWGLYDMHGNVWEWCEDRYDAPASSTQDAVKGDSPYRVRRGGAWADNSSLVRSSSRNFYAPVLTDIGIGFRVARAPL